MPRKLQVEDLLAFQLIGDAHISPSGDHVAYVVSRVDKEKNEYRTAIYLATPEGKSARFTGGENDSAPRFSPDGTRLAFLSKRSGQPQIWVMSVFGGEARQLTKVQGGVGEFAWAPSGDRIAFTAMLKADGIQPEVKEEKEDDLLRKHTKQVKVITELTHKMDGIGYYTERRPCLCVTGLAEGAEAVQLTQPPYRVSELAWSPDGQTLLFSSRMGQDYDREAWEGHLYAIPAAGGEARRLTPAGLSGHGPSVSPDGTTVAFFGVLPDDLGYGNTRLYTVPLAGGEPTRVASGWDRPFSHIGMSDMPAPGGGKLTWAPDGSALYCQTSVGGAVHLVSVNIATGEVTTLVGGDRQLYSYSLDARCRKAAVAIADPLNPGDLYYVDLREGTEQRLTEINGALLGELELSEPKRFYAQAPNGPRVDGWVMQPHGFEAGKRYPTVLEIHGGPMMMYSQAFFFEFQLLAAGGYGVVYSNPRGSQGYGEEFCKAIQLEWGNKDYADVLAIIDQAIAENPWIDPDRVGVTGGSYGGFMTNWIVGHTDRFKAAVSGRSICDWRGMVGTGDGGPSWIRRFGPAPWIDDTKYKQQSPITYVENVKTPILIEHQEGDLRCPIDQGMMWYSAIKHLGKAPVRFVTYPNEFHGMSRNGKPYNRIHRLNEITAWFDTYL